MMNHLVARSALKGALFAGAATSVLSSAALAQGRDDDNNRRVGVQQFWSVTGLTTYSDNFRRLSGDGLRFDGFVPTGVDPTVTPQTVPVPISYETPDNTIVSVSLRGSAVLQRPSFSGFFSGGIRIGTYLDSVDLDARILDESALDPAALNVPELELTGSTLGLGDSNSVFIDPNIVASGTYEGIENLLFLDGSFIAQEQALGRSSVLVQEGIGEATEEVTYVGGSLSPYINHRFSNNSVAEVRVRSTYVGVVDERVQPDQPTTANPNPEIVDRFTNDSFANEALVQYSTGDILDRLEFTVGGYARQVIEEGSDVLDEVDFTQVSTSLDIAFDLNRTLSLTGSVGYDEIQFNDDRDPIERAAAEDDLSGTNWNVGFRYVPNRRTSLQASVGERFGGTALNVSARHRLSEFVSITASAIRQLDSGVQDFVTSLQDVQGQSFQLLGLLSDSQDRSSAALLQRALAFESAGFRDVQRGQFGVSAFDRYRAGVSGNFRRTNLSASVSYSESEFTDRTNEQTSFQFRAARQVTRRFSVNGIARYIVNDGIRGIDVLATDDLASLDDIQSKDQFYSVGLDYQVGPRLSITGTVAHSQNDSDGAVQTGTQLDFEETTVSAGLRWSF